MVWRTVCGCSVWFGVVICGLGSRDQRLLSNHYIFSSINHAVRNFYLVFDPGMVITKYKMCLKLFKHRVGVCFSDFVTCASCIFCA